MNQANLLFIKCFSVTFLLWISIGGNTSRVTGLHVIDTLPVSLDGCPDTWNVTSRDSHTDPAAQDTWWLHVSIYEVSYMWYSGLACCIVVVLGSVLSLVPGLQQEKRPDMDLLVPVMEVNV